VPIASSLPSEDRTVVAHDASDERDQDRSELGDPLNVALMDARGIAPDLATMDDQIPVT
jgi:hypothetical protein